MSIASTKQQATSRCHACGARDKPGCYGEAQFTDQWFCCRCWDVWHMTACGRLDDRVPSGNVERSALSLGKWAERSDLDAFFRFHGSDKASGIHGYAKVYEMIFAPVRHREDGPRLLEVGIGTVDPLGISSMHYLLRDHIAPQYLPGASARAWRDYFSHGEIVAIDIDPKTMIRGEERITTYAFDSTGPDVAPFLAGVYGLQSFDIVIDDGSHTEQSQQQTLRNLWPLVSVGGMYVIEDVWWQQGDNHCIIHGSGIDPEIADILSEGGAFLTVASVGQGKWSRISHNSNLLVLRRPEAPAAPVD